MAYLYPDGAPDAEKVHRYLGVLEDIVHLAAEAGVEVVIVKPPVPQVFRDSLPGEAAFDAALRDRLEHLGIEFHDWSAAIPAPEFYFDTDHLNRAGVDALYRDHLLGLLVGE